MEGSIEGRGQSGREPDGPPATDPDAPHQIRRRPAGTVESTRAARTWWDHDADRYLRRHGAALGPVRLLWGPDGADEADLNLLGDVAGLTTAELGCGAGQVSRWLRSQGATTVGVDVSHRMLVNAVRLDQGEPPGLRGRWVQGDAARLPLAAATFDLAVSSYGALPFLPDLDVVFAEVARILRPGGRWVFSLTHPMRWCFPDDPGPAGLVVHRSYFDRRAYVEEGPNGSATYVEQHHTIGDVVTSLSESGFTLTRLVEPEWVSGSWGPWSEERGRMIPGTALFDSVRRP